MRKALKKKLKNLFNSILKNLNSERVTRPLKIGNINFPDRIPMDVPDAFPRFINNFLRIAVIVSNEMYRSLRYECLLIDIGKVNIKRVLSKKHLPDFLLVESRRLDHDSLINIIQMTKSKNIPVVLWVTTSLDSLAHHVDMLPLFALVFSTERGNMSALQELVHHERVFYLPFGVQPRLYNPISNTEKNVFAAYVPSKLIRGKDFITHEHTFLYDAARCYSAEVVDYENMSSSYKKYYVVLFDPLEECSPGNVYPLLYQLLACGVNVVSSSDGRLREEFGDNLLFVKSYEEALHLLDMLYSDSDYRDKLSLLGQRFVFDGNTYTHRIDTMLDKLEYHSLMQTKPGVSVVCCTHMESYMDNIFENYLRQTYDIKELIIVLNDPAMDKSLWEAKAKGYPNISIIQPNKKTSVGYCVNHAVENACYEYIANFDHDDYYGPEYLRDSINAFRYTDAGLVGKKTHYVYYEGSKTLALMLPGYENKYVVNIDGSSVVFKKSVFKKVRFIDRLFADIQFSLDCWNNGIKVYSCDRFNHVYVRAASKEYHAFKLSDEDLKALTYTIKESTDEYTAFVIS